MTEPRIVLIDGDIMLYKALFGAEESLEFGEELQLTCNMSQAKAGVRGFISDLEEKTRADRMIVCLSDPEANFRKEIYPDYKKQRKSVRKPIGLPKLREWVKENYQTVMKPRMEADDVMGILATTDRVLPGRKLIVTTDKDLLSVPGAHFNPSKPEQGVVKIDKFQAHYNHMFQTLTGDVVDNFPGCPGVGAKTAEKILHYGKVHGADHYSYWFDAVVAAYKKKGLTEDDALVQARLARILRAEDYDFESKEIRLWTPSRDR